MSNAPLDTGGAVAPSAPVPLMPADTPKIYAGEIWNNPHAALLIRRVNPKERDLFAQRFIDIADFHRALAIIGCSINDATDTDDCDCPMYTFDTWADAAIRGRQYRRQTGPAVRWAFALSSGGILEVRPIYEPIETARARLLADGIEMTNDSGSNWVAVGSVRLAIYAAANARTPAHTGWFNGYGSPVVTTGPQWLTDEVLTKLWAIHRDHRTAFAGVPWCGNCRRPLADDVSRKLGIGPECARQFGIAHTHAAARTAEVRQTEAAP